MGVSKNNLYCHWYKTEQINWPLSLYRAWAGHETTRAAPTPLTMPFIASGALPRGEDHNASLGDRSQGWTGLGDVSLPEGGKKKKWEKSGGGLHLFIILPICTESTEQNRRVTGSPMAVIACVASEGHTGTAVAQQAGQDASVKLVEFH